MNKLIAYFDIFMQGFMCLLTVCTTACSSCRLVYVYGVCMYRLLHRHMCTVLSSSWLRAAPMRIVLRCCCCAMARHRVMLPCLWRRVIRVEVKNWKMSPRDDVAQENRRAKKDRGLSQLLPQSCQRQLACERFRISFLPHRRREHGASEICFQQCDACD